MLPSYSPGTRDTMVRRAGAFFAEVITPIEKTHRTARESNLRLNAMIGKLHRRSADLKISNRQLKKEIVQRKLVEQSLRNSEHTTANAGQSNNCRNNCGICPQFAAQEEERKRISRSCMMKSPRH